MGADERLFAPQREVLGDQLVVPKWTAPLEGESLVAYAQRLAEKVDPKKPCFVGGASFGGFVAMEMARHLQTIAVFLIGSVRTPDELPPSLRALRPIRKMLVTSPLEVLAKAGATTARISAGGGKGVVAQFAQADTNFIRWACEAVLAWVPSNDTLPKTVPIFQIHGSSDAILPARLTKPTKLIKGAGHVLSLTHPREVNKFLRDHMLAAAKKMA
jgi:pimeloyl-ACP methyl ester carboxylesterase